MARNKPQPTERADRKLLQTRISDSAAELLQARLKRQDITAAAYLKRLVMVDLGLLRPGER